MKIKKYTVLFLLLCQSLFAEIREVTSLEEFSEQLLNPSYKKKQERKIEKIEATSKMISTSQKGNEEQESIWNKNTSSFIDISEKERRGEIVYRQGEEQPFTGVFALFMGEWIQYIETYKNGILEGESSWYTQNGTRVLYENYSGGKLQGKQLSYYENGNPKAEIYYEKGKIVGVVCFARDGKTLHRSIFENGTGIWKLYWENGNLLESGKYTNFKKDGTWKKYHEDGSLENTLEYQNGRLVRETWG